MKENNPNRNRKQHFEKGFESPENHPAKLHVIGAAITTLGEAILTIAALAELQELEEEQRLSNIQSHLLKEQTRQLEQMQK